MHFAIFLCVVLIVFTQDSLQTCLQTKVPLLLSRNQVRLIVVDSLAALFRSEYDQDKLSTRAKHLASVAWQLRRLADQYHAVVVCVNQVTHFISVFNL